MLALFRMNIINGQLVSNHQCFSVLKLGIRQHQSSPNR